MCESTTKDFNCKHDCSLLSHTYLPNINFISSTYYQTHYQFCFLSLNSIEDKMKLEDLLGEEETKDQHSVAALLDHHRRQHHQQQLKQQVSQSHHI